MTDESRQSPAGPEVIVPRSMEVMDYRSGDGWEPARGPHPGIRARKRRALVLFLLTCLSTYLTGGLSYAVPVMLILLAHEMGHFLQAVRYGVPASLPYFIPMPFISPFGTMGAVIFQGRGSANRKVMFDIAISGPLAGLVLALPITYIGLTQSTIQPLPSNVETLIFGEPLIFKWMTRWIHGPVPEGYETMISPLGFAGWVGIFITALNLIPIGQLDGGHVLYTLIGRRAHTVALLLLALAVGFMVYTQSPAYGLMVLLLILIGPKHPPTADDTVPLGWPRIILGWLTLAFLFLGFTPTPITIPDAEPRPPAQHAPEPPTTVTQV